MAQATGASPPPSALHPPAEGGAPAAARLLLQKRQKRQMCYASLSGGGPAARGGGGGGGGARGALPLSLQSILGVFFLRGARPRAPLRSQGLAAGGAKNPPRPQRFEKGSGARLPRRRPDAASGLRDSVRAAATRSFVQSQPPRGTPGRPPARGGARGEPPRNTYSSADMLQQPGGWLAPAERVQAPRRVGPGGGGGGGVQGAQRVPQVPPEGPQGRPSRPPANHDFGPLLELPATLTPEVVAGLPPLIRFFLSLEHNTHAIGCTFCAGFFVWLNLWGLMSMKKHIEFIVPSTVYLRQMDAEIEQVIGTILYRRRQLEAMTPEAVAERNGRTVPGRENDLEILVAGPELGAPGGSSTAAIDQGRAAAAAVTDTSVIGRLQPPPSPRKRPPPWRPWRFLERARAERHAATLAVWESVTDAEAEQAEREEREELAARVRGALPLAVVDTADGVVSAALAVGNAMGAAGEAAASARRELEVGVKRGVAGASALALRCMPPPLRRRVLLEYAPPEIANPEYVPTPPRRRLMVAPISGEYVHEDQKQMTSADALRAYDEELADELGPHERFGPWLPGDGAKTPAERVVTFATGEPTDPSRIPIIINGRRIRFPGDDGEVISEEEAARFYGPNWREQYWAHWDSTILAMAARRSAEEGGDVPGSSAQKLRERAYEERFFGSWEADRRRERAARTEAMRAARQVAVSNALGRAVEAAAAGARGGEMRLDAEAVAALPPVYVPGDEDADFTLGLKLNPPMPNLISDEADKRIRAECAKARDVADAYSQLLADDLGIPMRRCRDPVWDFRAEPKVPHPARRTRRWFVPPPGVEV